MTVQELKDTLEGMDADAEVRLAMQPQWAFEYSINDIVVVEDKDGNNIAYLSEGRQLGYLPGNVAEELGWK